MHQAEILMLLLAAMTVLVVFARKINVPYPVVLVVGGLVISFIPRLPTLRLSPDFVFYFCLPALIYPAALFTSWRDFRRNLSPILFLAIGLVLFTIFVVAIVARAILPAMPWPVAFALGAIVSPPDAVAASAILRRLAVPQRIDAILEGESLVNDATALVALRFAIAAITTGTFSLGQASLEFLWVAAGGIAFGLLVGYCARWVQSHLDDPPINISISFLTPFLAYLPAERFHLSGVLATVAAGIFLGWHSPLTLRARTRLQAVAFWEMIVFVINGLIFVTIGLQLPAILGRLTNETWPHLFFIGATVSGAVVLVRVAWVLAAVALRRLFARKDRQISWPHGVLISWSGMRGVISLAAAFAYPFAVTNVGGFPARGYILFLTFCVILTTLVLQGLTLPFVLRKLGITDDGANDDEECTARVEANRAALALIDRLAKECDVSNDAAERLRVEYRERMQQLAKCAGNDTDGSGEISTPHYQRLQYEALKVERETIIRLRNERVINDEALRRIQRDLDLAEARLTGD